MTIYAYARTSVDNKMSISIEAQLDFIKKKITNKKFISFFDKGISGAMDQRPSFNKLKKVISSSNEMGILYVWRYDRIARNTKHLLEFLVFCEDYHIQVRSITEPLPEGMGYSNATQKMFIQVLGILAEMQRNVTIENINATLIHKKKNKQYLGSIVPIGYKLVDKKVVQDPVYAQIIKRLFELYVTGNYGYKKLQNKLIEEGFYYKNDSLTIPQIHGILTNPLYYGWIKGGKIGGYYGDFEPIVSEELFQQVQRIKKQRHSVKKDDRTYPLRKKIACPYCQWYLSPKRLNNNQTNCFYHYYHCANRQCKGIMISAKQLEGEVLDQLRLFLGNKEVINSLIREFKGQLVKQKKQVQQRLASTEREQKRIIQKYEKGELLINELKQNLELLDQRKPQSNDDRIPENELLNRLNQLLKLQQESVREVLWDQIRKVTISSNKCLKEIYLMNLTENILQINKENEHD